MPNVLECILEETPRHQFAGAANPYRLASEKRYLAVLAAGLGLNPAPLDRSDEERGSENPPQILRDTFAPTGRLRLRCYINDLPWLLELAGWVGTRTTGAGGGTNEVQTVTITGAPTGGTFTLTFRGATTAPLAYNASVAQVQAALEALGSIEAGGVLVAGGPLPGTAITVTFQNQLAGWNVPQMTAAHNFTGGTTPNVAVTTTTPGVAGAVADPDGRTIPATAQRWVYAKRTGILTAQSAQLTLIYANEAFAYRGTGFGISSLSITAAGEVTAELVGLYLDRIDVPAITPVYDANSIPPIRRGDLFITSLANGGNPSDFSVNLVNPIEAYSSMSIDPPSDYPDKLEVADARVMVTGTIPKRAIDNEDYVALRDATAFPLVARWQTRDKNILSTSYPYGLWLECPKAQYTEGGDPEYSQARRHPADFTWRAGEDEATGKDATITIVNSISAVKTYL